MRVSAGLDHRASPATDGIGQQEHREDHEGELSEQRAEIELGAVLADEQREPEDEQDVRDDASRHRAAHDAREVVVDRDHGDDHLRRVAEACVQQAADARARVFTRMLRGFPISHASGTSESGGENEQDRLVRVERGRRRES